MKYSTYAKKWLGTKEGTKAHKHIIDWYNKNIKPLPRSYKVKYSDAWCATFVSFVMAHCEPINPPYECSVENMYQKCKNQNQLVKKPRVDDIVFYDWNIDKHSDHVGIITKISGDILTVIEGNKSDTVGYRTISTHSRYLRGYARIKRKQYNIDIVDKVIKGEYGTGDERKKKLESEGYNYKEVQAEVNKRMKKK